MGELVVRLVGDGSSYQKMLMEAIEQTKQSAQAVEEQGKKVEKFRDQLKELGHTMVEAFAAKEMFDWLKEAKQEWFAAELVAVRLQAVLETNGRNVKQLTKEYEEFAKEIEKTTIVADDNTFAMLKQAETHRVTGEAAKRAVRDAIAIGAANDGTGESYVRLTSAMARNDIESAMRFARMVEQLRGAKDEADFAERYHKLIEQGTRMAEAEARTGSGRAKQFANQYNNLQEDFGKIFTRVINPMKIAKKEAVEFLSQLTEDEKTAIVYTVSFTGAMLALGPVIKATQVAVMALGRSYAFLATQRGMATAKGAAAVAIGVELGAMLYNEDAQVRKLTASLERNQKAQEGVLGVWEKRNAETLNKVRTVVDPDSQQKAINEELARAQQLIAGLKSNVNSLNKESKSLESWWRIGPFKDAQLKVNEQSIEGLNQRIQQQQELIQKLNELKAGTPDRSALIAKDAADLNEKLKEQAALFGQDGTEADIARLRMKGATEEQLKEAKAISESIHAMELEQIERQKIQEDAAKRSELHKTTLSGLQDEIALMGVSANGQQIYKLAKEGLTAAEIEQVRALQQQRDAAKAQQDAMEKGKQLAEQYADPADKLVQKQKELQSLYERGAITQDTYNKAMSDTQKQFDDASDSASKTMNQVQQLDATLARSSTAQQRASDFLEKHRAAVQETRTRAERVGRARVATAPVANTDAGYAPGQGSNTSSDGTFLAPMAIKLFGYLNKLATNTEPERQATWADHVLVGVAEGFSAL